MTETRKQYVSKVKGILLRLKNSIDKPDLESKIKKAEKALNEFAEEMESKGYWRISRFFRRNMRSILLFAYKSLKGYESFFAEVMKDRDIRWEVNLHL